MKASEILASADNWTWFSNAKNARGHTASVHEADACRFCLRGAFLRAHADLPLARIPFPKIDEILANVIVKYGFPRYMSGQVTQLSDESVNAATVTTFNDASGRAFCDVRKVAMEAEQVLEALCNEPATS